MCYITLIGNWSQIQSKYKKTPDIKPLTYNNIIIIARHLLSQYRRKESISVAYLVQGFGKLMDQVQCKFHQQVIRWSGNLGRISKSEKVGFEMLTETMLFDDLTC